MFHYLVSSKHSNRLPNISCIITLVLFSASVTSVSIFGTAKTALIENIESNLNSSTNQVLIMHIIHMLLPYINLFAYMSLTSLAFQILIDIPSVTSLLQKLTKIWFTNALFLFLNTHKEFF